VYVSFPVLFSYDRGAHHNVSTRPAGGRHALQSSRSINSNAPTVCPFTSRLSVSFSLAMGPLFRFSLTHRWTLRRPSPGDYEYVTPRSEILGTLRYWWRVCSTSVRTIATNAARHRKLTAIIVVVDRALEVVEAYHRRIQKLERKVLINPEVSTVRSCVMLHLAILPCC